MAYPKFCPHPFPYPDLSWATLKHGDLSRLILGNNKTRKPESEIWNMESGIQNPNPQIKEKKVLQIYENNFA